MASIITSFNNNKINYLKINVTRYFKEIYSVYKTDKKARIDELKVGNYYWVEVKKIKTRRLLIEIKPNMEYVFEHNGTKQSIFQNNTEYATGIYKEVFSTRDDRTDVVSMYNITEKTHFELNIYNDGKIDAIRANN